MKSSNSSRNQHNAQPSLYGRMYQARLDVLAVIALCVGVAVAIRAFWQPGVTSEADMLVGVYRLFELDQSWGEHIFYPRVGMNLNFGYSGPLFQYYPPLASYVALAFHWVGLGWIEAAKAGFTLALVLAGLGAYVYARWLFKDSRAALVAGFAYLLAPYLLLNVYERGDSAELLALGLIPWLVWAMHHRLQSDNRTWLWASTGSVALLILAHNITALFVIPLLGGYLVLLAWHESAWHRLPGIILAFGLGLGLSAFYWMPAFLERGFSQIEGRMLSGPNRPEMGLQTLEGLFQTSLAFDYWGGQRFHPALWQAIAAGIGVLAVVLVPRKLRFNLIVVAGALAIIYILQLNISRAFWLAAPLVRFIQFPWRLLGPASFLTALLLGALPSWRRLNGGAGWIVVAVLLVLISYAALRNLDLRFSSGWRLITDTQIGEKDLYERGTRGSPLYGDYTSISMQGAPWEMNRPRAANVPRLPPLTDRPNIQVTAEGANCIQLQVQTPAPFALRLPRIYFPTWQISIKDQPAPTTISPPFGLVTAELPAGSYPVKACFADTPLRQVANGISIILFLAYLLCGRRTWPFARVLQAGAILLLLLAVFAFWRQGLGQPPRHPTAYAAQFEDEISLLGYDLDKPVLRPGDTLDLRLYWLAEKTPATDYKIFVHLRKPDDSDTVAQIDEPPLFGQDFTTRWDPGELITDRHQLTIDNSIPPGVYKVLIGLYRPDTVRNLRVSGAAEVLPGDRVAITQIEIRGK